MQESAQAFIFHFHHVCEKLCVPMFATVSRAEKDLTYFHRVVLRAAMSAHVELFY